MAAAPDDRLGHGRVHDQDPQRKSETFAPGVDFADGDMRQHWTLSGLDKLIALGIWNRQLDRRGMVVVKPPTVEQIRRFASAPAA